MNLSIIRNNKKTYPIYIVHGILWNYLWNLYMKEMKKKIFKIWLFSLWWLFKYNSYNRGHTNHWFFCAIDISDYEIQIPLNVRFILWFVYVYIFHSQQTIYLISVKNIFKHI